jgi:hypothetical protein
MDAAGLARLESSGQRWRDGRPCFPGREVMRTGSLDVGVLEDDTTAKGFVLAHHYSGTYPAARRRYGLHRAGELVGVAVFSVPASGAVLDILPCPRDASVELGRLVLLDDVAANAESWFVARCFELLRRDGFAGVVSFSDPQPRATVTGELVLPGHVGTTYKALNAVYTGRGRARPLWLLPDGRVFSDRAQSKIRSRDRGWRYASAQLEDAGAALLTDEDAGAWLKRELPRVCRRIKHRGNHRYLWPLDRATRKALPAHLAARGVASLPYPHQIEPLG